MDVTHIPALAALAGSVVGSLTAVGTSWLTNQAKTREHERSQDRATREHLYKDFIVEASRLYGDALVSDKPEVTKLIELFAMISRMRVRSSPRVIEHAHQVGREIVKTYFAPNKTLVELRDMLDGQRMDLDPLQGFSNACREELRPG